MVVEDKKETSAGHNPEIRDEMSGQANAVCGWCLRMGVSKLVKHLKAVRANGRI